MKPGRVLADIVLGEEKASTEAFRIWAGSDGNEVAVLKPHLRLRDGARQACLTFHPPDHPAILPERRRAEEDGHAYVIRAASRPLLREECDPVATLAWIGPVLDAVPGLTPDTLRVDDTGVIRVAPTGLAPGPLDASSRAAIAAWLGAPADTAANPTPARVQAALPTPLPASPTRFVLWLPAIPDTAVAAVAVLSGTAPEPVLEASRRRAGWAVAGFGNLADAQRSALRLRARGLPVEVVPVGLPSPSFVPAVAISLLGQGALALDGTAQAVGLVLGTALGAGLLIRSLRQLRPWAQSRTVDQAWRQTERSRVPGVARTLAELLTALPSQSLPALARQSLRDALEEAQDLLLDGGTLDPGALVAIRAAMDAPAAHADLAPAVGALTRAMRQVRQKAAPSR